MRFFRFISVLIFLIAFNAQAAEADDEWSMLSRMLSFLQTLTQAAIEDQKKGGEPKRLPQTVDAMLAGKNTEFNSMMDEMLVDVPKPERDKLLSLARQFGELAKLQSKAQSSDSAALQARKDLTAMGLSYYDARQFIDAVKRNDVLAVKLFITGKGVDVNAQDADGVTALHLAKRAGHDELAALLTRAGAKH